MYIKEIIIENFRQLKNCKLSFENGVTILAGPNNSGKTTLINLLKKYLMRIKYVLMVTIFQHQKLLNGVMKYIQL
ncbi:hypothetical protein K144312032_04510 [Clostridium tetani]|uniref:AAA family ATPase n=1 Tax=Clostridium tetani TaxID=1513 RepID=UPI00308C5403|nr:hypothetical protein K144312032_04510 [Clostridium tetani]